MCIHSVLSFYAYLFYFIIIISSKSPVIKQALKLLNTHGGEFDAAKVQGRKEEGREWRIVAAWQHACLF